MSDISSVGIIGCGWLGKALAVNLKALNIKVMATRSSAENAAELRSEGIDCKILSLPAEQAQLNAHEIFNNQCLVISITPQFRHGRVDYAEKVNQLILAAKQSAQVQRVILLSSTAVYNGLVGDVTESMDVDFTADKVSVLYQAEQAVLSFNASAAGCETNQPNDKNSRRSYVLRLSGLVGPDRHPGKFLVTDRMFKSPHAIVNLIHQQDAVGLILSILESDLSGGIFNGVSDTKVTKQEYYQAAAKAVQLPAPQFEDVSMSNNVSSKMVSNEKTSAMVAYNFIHADLLKWLGQSIG